MNPIGTKKKRIKWYLETSKICRHNTSDGSTKLPRTVNIPEKIQNNITCFDNTSDDSIETHLHMELLIGIITCFDNLILMILLKIQRIMGVWSTHGFLNFKTINRKMFTWK